MNTPTTPPTPDTPDVPDVPGTSDTSATQALPDPSRSPDPLADPNLADEVFVDDDRTMALPTTATPATTAGATMTATAPAPAPASTPAPPAPPEPQYLTGPAPFALVLGLLGLLVAGSVLLNELTDVTLPWGDLGPWTVVAAGLVVGAIGLRSSRSRDTRG
jgi:hypothetical protein